MDCRGKMPTKKYYPLLVLCSFIISTISCGSSSGSSVSTATEAPLADQSEESEVAEESLPSNCSDITSQKGRMTEVQWETYLDSLKGETISDWSGRVEKVDEGGLGFFASGYTMRVVIDQDCDVLFTLTDEAEALSYSKGQIVSMRGEIDFFSETFGFVVYLEDDPSITSGALPTQDAPSETPIPLDYLQFLSNYYGMTDLQQEQYESSLVGSRVLWTAKVEDVSEQGRIQLTVPSDYPFIWVYLDGVSLEKAATFDIGQPITFDAVVRETGTGKLSVGFAVYLEVIEITSE